MTTLEQQSRPGGGSGAAQSVVATRDQDTGGTPRPHLSADERASARPAYCLLVKSPTDRLSRRLFLSLPAAMRAAERAQQRGSSVHLELCHIVPVTPEADTGGDAR